MKIALASKGKSIDSEMDMAFGRCPFFAIVEVGDGKIVGSSFLENTARAQHGGAGLTAGQIVGDQGVEAVIVKNMGPKAFAVMGELGIDSYRGFSGTIRENVVKFISGELEKFSSPPAFGRRHMI